VVAVAALPLLDEADGLQHLRLEALFRSRLQERVPAVRRVADAERLDGLLGEPPLPEVVEPALSARPLELVEVEPRGEAEGRQHRLALARLLATPLVLHDLDAGPLSQQPHRVEEPHALDLLDELEQVAPGLAPEAVEEVLPRVHRERRRLLVVERAEPDEPGPLLLRADVVAHHVHEVDGAADLFDDGIGDASHGGSGGSGRIPSAEAWGHALFRDTKAIAWITSEQQDR